MVAFIFQNPLVRSTILPKNEAAKLETVSCNEYHWRVDSQKGEIE
jgi:hypothetical protein